MVQVKLLLPVKLSWMLEFISRLCFLNPLCEYCFYDTSTLWPRLASGVHISFYLIECESWETGEKYY